MKIYIKVKSLGKKRPILDNVSYILPDDIKTVREFISELVKVEVEKYNQKGTDMQLIPFLSNQQIEEQASVGKVGFGRIFSDKKADLEKAIENALQCYEDGIVRAFQNEEELGALGETLSIREGDCFTFIRLTFLAGRLW